MGVHVEGMAFHAAEDPRHLHIEAQLEADLSLAGGTEPADLCHLAKAEDHVEEVLLWLLCLDCPHINDFLHQED